MRTLRVADLYEISTLGPAIFAPPRRRRANTVDMALAHQQQPEDANLRLRIDVWRHRAQLDAALAAGADPTARRPLALRARQLTDPTTRCALANAIANVVDAAEEPAESWRLGGPRPPLQREAVAVARDLLFTVVEHLRHRPRVSPQAAALASLMVWDSASPLYSPLADATVTAWAQTLIDALAAER